MQSYTIKIDQFEGPFDLLLFFIERDELDIHNIPIAKITKDFLDYIQQLETLNIDVASEFILVAASLMRIKAKLLIPRKEIDEEGNEIDPRAELTQKLLEYKRYKAIISDLEELAEVRSQKYHRGNAASELKMIASKALVDAELESLNLYKLLKTFQSLMKRYEEEKNKVIHRIVKYNYTIGEQQMYIKSKLHPGSKTNFKDLFAEAENRIHAIITFLALLELLNVQFAKITQGDGTNNFWVEPVNPADRDEEE